MKSKGIINSKSSNIPAYSEVLKAIFTIDRYLYADENSCIKSRTYLGRMKQSIPKEKSKLKGMLKFLKKVN